MRQTKFSFNCVIESPPCDARLYGDVEVLQIHFHHIIKIARSLKQLCGFLSLKAKVFFFVAKRSERKRVNGDRV